MDRGGDTAASRPNQLHVNHDSRRPLFASKGPQSKADMRSAATSVGTGAARPGGTSALIRRAKSDPQGAATGADYLANTSSASILSPGGSRIPRPNPSGLQQRRPISLAEAFKLAQEEEEEAERERQQGGSPSPAPRTWRARPGQPQDELQARKMLAEDPLDNRARGNQAKNLDSRSPEAKSKITEPENIASKRAGNGSSLQDRINEWRTKSRPGSEWADKFPDSLADVSREAHLPELVPGIEDVPFSSIESPVRNPPFISPSRNFTWQVDEDFTAGDLQVSDSPRIRVGNDTHKPFAKRPSILERIDVKSPGIRNSPGTRNTKLEEIRARELSLAGESVAGHSALTPQHPRRYTKLEEIRAREAAADKQIPIPDRSQPRPKNTKIDEIRQRETDGLSKRAIAAARLEEIREKNAMTKSLLPEKQISRQQHPEMRPPPARPKPALEAGERIPDTPVTVFKSYRLKQENTNAHKAKVSPDQEEVGPGKPEVSERDLLRRLARAASSSPAPEAVNKRAPLADRQKPNEIEKPVAKMILASQSGNNGRKSSLVTHNKDNASLRPTVGFSGLKRIPSTESTKSKKSSMHSDSDPTDRIEAELKLFAPRDDYSEPGSARASSPQPDSDEEQQDVAETTPKVQKHEFLQMETPRVTGAYVDTPVTEKVDKVKEENMDDIKPFKQKLNEQQQATSENPDAPALFRDKNPTLAWRNKEEDTVSEPGARNEKSGDSGASSAAHKGPRSRSVPRRRPPPKNSAKPPSVKDDLRELQRQHNIDDSTLDDLEDVLTGRKHASPRLRQLLEELPAKREHEIDDELRVMEEEVYNMKQEGSEDKDMSAGELALYDKMNKSLRTGLSSIRTARLGIEKLEDQVAHSEKQSAVMDSKTKPDRTEKPQHNKAHAAVDAEQYPERKSHAGKVTASPLHFSMSWSFLSTPLVRSLGLLVLMLLSWLAAEWAMCRMYCRPAACTTMPCVYSYDDPTFGNAIPVKLDQWTAGGHGRKLATWVVAELQDWAADIEDAIYGRSLADVSVDELGAAERSQHRRRLHKRGLLKQKTRAGPDQTAKWDAWRRSRLAKERSRHVGYDTGDDGSWTVDTLGKDERVL